MSERQKMTEAELEALLDRIWGPKQKPKPKVVTSEGEAVRDADVKVSSADPNYSRSNEGVVRVRRNDFVTLRLDLYEQQVQQRREDRRHRRVIDPARMGLWNGGEDD
jgi:hypothetical protein